jgi:alanine dehydrogenase
MIIGVPKEIKVGEKRVGIVSSGVSAFVAHGHKVLIEKGAGLGSGISDEDYRRAGAKIMSSAKQVWEQADMIIKVKEPLENEIQMCRPGQIYIPIFI